MPVGEVLALILKFASDFDGDELLILKSVDSITVNQNYIELSFVDANTSDYRIYKDGTRR